MSTTVIEESEALEVLGALDRAAEPLMLKEIEAKTGLSSYKIRNLVDACEFADYIETEPYATARRASLTEEGLKWLETHGDGHEKNDDSTTKGGE